MEYTEMVVIVYTYNREIPDQTNKGLDVISYNVRPVLIPFQIYAHSSLERMWYLLATTKIHMVLPSIVVELSCKAYIVIFNYY